MKDKFYRKACRPRSVVWTDKEGLSLIELLVAVAIIGVMSLALYSAGFSIVRHTQTVTIKTAAQMYAKEGLEELISSGYTKLMGGQPIVQQIREDTHNVALIRTPRIIWHNSDGSTSSVAVVKGYAEAIVQVTWTAPRTSHTGLVAISTLIF